jgi:hypothetical protein
MRRSIPDLRYMIWTGTGIPLREGGSESGTVVENAPVGEATGFSPAPEPTVVS